MSALALSIALVISLGGMARASYNSIDEWMRIALNPDMFLTPTQNITDRSFRFPASFADEIRQLPGVRYTQVVRNARILFNGNPVMFVSLDVANLRPESYLPAIQGDSKTMYRLAAEGKGQIEVQVGIVRMDLQRLPEMMLRSLPRSSL